jgi:hypothetical protein
MADISASIIELRQAGVPVDAIASRLGLPVEEVQAIVLEALAERSLEHRRLERMLAAVWSKAVQGDPIALDRALSIMRLLRDTREESRRVSRETTNPKLLSRDDMDRMLGEIENG